MISFLAPLVIAIGMGVGITFCFFPSERPLLSDLVLKVSLGIGIGFGITACAFFYSLIVYPEPRNRFMALEAAMLISLIAALFMGGRKGDWRWPSVSKREDPHPALSQRERVHWSLWLALTGSIVVTGYVLIVIFRGGPHGGWDAWAFWNTKSRHIFGGGTKWVNSLFSLYLAHPDYPLMIPSSVARIWHYLGTDRPAGPAVVAASFGVATAGLLFAGLSRLTTKTRAILATLVLLGTPFFVLHIQSLYADVPLAFFLLATVVLFSAHDIVQPRESGLAILAGLTAGLACWAKNEGLVFCVALILTRLAIALPSKGIKRFATEMAYVGIGFVPIIAMVAYFKMTFAPPNDVVGGLDLSGTIVRLTEPSRHLNVLGVFANQTLQFGQWWVRPYLPMALYTAVAGLKLGNATGFSRSTALLVSLLTCSGYHIVLVAAVNPDLDAINRLVFHLWPTLIFGWALMTR